MPDNLQWLTGPGIAARGGRHHRRGGRGQTFSHSLCHMTKEPRRSTVPPLREGHVPARLRVIASAGRAMAAGPAGSSIRRLLRSPRGSPALPCSLTSWFPNIAITCRSIDKARSLPGRASRSTARPCQLGRRRLLVARVAAEMARRAVFASQKLLADDTPLPVLDPGRGRTKTGRPAGLRTRRPALERARSIGCRLSLQPRPQGRAACLPSGQVQRCGLGRRLFRVRAARHRHPARGLLGACAALVYGVHPSRPRRCGKCRPLRNRDGPSAAKPPSP